MSLRRFLSTNSNVEATQSSLDNDRTPTYASNLTTASTHTDGVNSLSDRMRALSGSDSVTVPDETESSLTDTLGVAEKATPRYSKRLSSSSRYLLTSHLCEFC